MPSDCPISIGRFKQDDRRKLPNADASRAVFCMVATAKLNNVDPQDLAPTCSLACPITRPSAFTSCCLDSTGKLGDVGAIRRVRNYVIFVFTVV